MLPTKRGEVWWVLAKRSENTELPQLHFDPSLGGEIRKQCLIRKAGDLSSSDMQAVEQAIRVQLGLGS